MHTETGAGIWLMSREMLLGCLHTILICQFWTIELYNKQVTYLRVGECVRIYFHKQESLHVTHIWYGDFFAGEDEWDAGKPTTYVPFEELNIF